jgi:hypothetical protein
LYGRDTGGIYAGVAVLTVAATALRVAALIILRRQPADVTLAKGKCYASLQRQI